MNVIPNELFNAVDVPADGQSAVRITDYLKTVAYRLPNCSDLMIEREFWNTVCDFAERAGSLREKHTGTLDSDKALQLAQSDYGDINRLVGAGLSSSPVSVAKVSVVETSTYPKVVFADGTSGATAYAIYSVVPDVDAAHDKTPSSSGGTTTYPNDKWIVPRWFIRRYDNLLLAGTLFRLLGMTGRPWTDFNAAKTNALAYNREINRVTHGLITSGMRKQILIGAENVFIGNAQAAAQPAQ